MNILPWEELSLENKLDFILLNLDENDINKLTDKLYRKEFKKEIILTDEVKELEEKYTTTILELNKDVISLIGLETNYKDLFNLCQTNKNINKLCEDPLFLIKYVHKNYYISMNLLLHLRNDIIKLKKLINLLFSNETEITKYENILEGLKDMNLPIKILNDIYVHDKGYLNKWSELNYIDISFGGDKICSKLIENNTYDEFNNLENKDNIFVILLDYNCIETLKHIIEVFNFIPYSNDFSYNFQENNINFIYYYLVKERGWDFIITDDFLKQITVKYYSFPIAEQIYDEQNKDIEVKYIINAIYSAIGKDTNFIKETMIKYDIYSKSIFSYILSSNPRNILYLNLYKEIIDLLLEKNEEITSNYIIESFSRYAFRHPTSTYFQFDLLQYLVDEYGLRFMEEDLELFQKLRNTYNQYILTYIENNVE